MAGCMQAKATHALLDEFGLCFFRFIGFGKWPDKSADMNPAESVGAIMQESVEDALFDAPARENQRGTFGRDDNGGFGGNEE